MEEMERVILLHTLDSRWKDHLYAMDSLKEGIGLRGYGQKDPLIEYKREAFEMFEGLIHRVKEEVAKLILKLQISQHPSVERVLIGAPQAREPALVGANRTEGSNSSGKRVSSAYKRGRKVGRNEPCPCGSGKKYKYCCGRNR